MLHPFAILVAASGDRYEVTVPFVDARRFTGRSPSTLYDDVALALMQRVFEGTQDALPSYLYCPETILRRVKIAVTFRDAQRWEGRLAVVLRRWPGEDFYEATVPRLSLARFIVDRPGNLESAIVRWLIEKGRDDATVLIVSLESARSRATEYLDFLEVDLELPTILPRTVQKKKRASRDAAPTEEERAKRRREVPPTTRREVGVNVVNRVLDGRVARTIGREALVESIARRIARPGAAVLLVGPSGVGKTAIVEAAIAKITSEESRLHARMDAWRIDANRLIAGMSVVGQWEARCEAMVHELSSRGDLLVVDDLPSLVWAGRTRHEETNVAGFLEPHLAQGELRMIGECTPERLEAARDLAPSFFAAFHLVWVPPLDEPTSLRVVLQRAREIERASMHAGDPIRIDPAVPSSILALTRRFAASQHLPGKAVRLLAQLATEAPADRRDEDDRRVLDREALVDLFAAQTGLPRFVLWEADGRPHDEVLAHFDRRIVAQRAAAEAVSEIVTTLQQGMNDPGKPIASLLLVGPTGVGKTETAKALAEYLFGSAARLVRFDMSEMQDAWSATRLFGDALRPDGELTRRVRQQPFAVILFDEIEKAHPAVFDALLALLGEGRLTSADGRTTDFCNTVVLMTSNLGVRDAESIGFAELEPPDRSAHYVSAVRAFFRPELFNRIDRIVAYRALGRSAVRPLSERAILELMSRRGLRRAGVLVDVEDALVDVLAERGFDPRYGARSLRRAVEQELAVPLARRLVSAPAEATTLVSLFREGEGVGIEVWPLLLPVSAATQSEAPIESWDALRARFDALRARIARGSAVIDRARDLHTILLGRYTRGLLVDEEWARFSMIGDLVNEMASIDDQLARLEEELVDEQFEARVEVAHQSVDRWLSPSAMPDVVLTETLLSPSSARPPRRHAEALRELGLAIAQMLHRAAIAEAPIEDVLVRILPATRDPSSLALAGKLAHALAWTWQSWGDLTVYVRGDGAWRALIEPIADTPCEGVALALRGIDARALVAPELGFHLATRFSGPDLIAGLARVEEVCLICDPIARLNSLDEEHAAFVESRRRGEAGANPRGPLPLRRRFEQGVAVDPDTGVKLRLERLPVDVASVLRHRLARERS